MDLTGHIAWLNEAVAAATYSLRQASYYDPISKQPEYSVRTALPGADSVGLAFTGIRIGAFKLSRVPEQRHTELGPSVPSATPSIQYLTPAELLESVVEHVQKNGSTSPSSLALERLLDHFVHEIEVLPQVIYLERQHGII